MRPLVEGYDEFRLRINRRWVGSYDVFASTRSAEASSSFEPAFNEREIENFALELSRPRGGGTIDSSGIGDARRFGEGLFKALFRGEIYGLYHDALANARFHDRGLRITLCLSQAPDLIGIPWEYLYDADFLALSALTPVVRYLDLPREHRPLLVERPLRLLGIVSSPSDYEQLDVERERDNLERSLSALRAQGEVELEWLERPTLPALLRKLRDKTFHAIHYIGHGAYGAVSGRGALVFEDDSGWAYPVSGDKLGTILHDFSSLRLAILNACEGARTTRADAYAGVAGSLVQHDIPAVIAMQSEISDEAAISFASGFYEALAAGIPVDASVAAARVAMVAERGDDIEWATPVLFMRVADGRIFDFHGGDSLGAVARSDLSIACQMIVAAIAGGCTSVSVNDVAASVCVCSAGDAFDEVARFYLPYERPPTAVRWQKGKGVAGWAWAVRKDLFCDLRPLITRLDREGAAAFDALPEYERFGMSADELDRSRTYTGVGAIQLNSQDHSATLRGMLIIDYSGEEGFDCIARQLQRFPISAYAGGCASVLDVIDAFRRES